MQKIDEQTTGGLLTAFTAHPATVGESYGQHFAFACRFGLRLVAAGCAALIHAIIPALFQTTASRLIREMHADIVRRSGTNGLN